MVINNLIETHSHILPAIDDGAGDTEMSLHMLQRLTAQGAEKVIVTPHYYSDSISLADFIEKRDSSLSLLKEALPEGSPEIIAGAEVYISRYIFGNDDLSKICIGSTRYALIEHSFLEKFSEKAVSRLESLIADYNIIPILAHIERYRALMDNPHTLDRLINLGCKTQVNISSFTDAPRGIRKKLLKHLDAGRIDIIGSDCHNVTTRAPHYGSGAQEIIDKFGKSALDKLISNANEMFA